MPPRFVVGLVVGAILVAGCSSPAGPTVQPPTPAPTATPEPTAAPSAASASPAAEATVPIDWKTYTSSRYAYSIDYPSDWIATPASQDWPATGFSYPEDPAIDKWVRPGNSPTWVLMFVSSVPLKVDEKPTERMARLDADNASVCQLSKRTDITIDGSKARQEEGNCFGSDFIREVAAVHGGRFYLIYVLSGSPLDETSLATFDHFLGSFHFGSS